MNLTPNLNLRKPEGHEIADFEDLNANMDVIDGKLGTSGHNHNGTAGNGPKITNAGLAAAAADDTAIGNRTINQALASPANTGTITQLLSWLSGRIKAITGATNWYDTPAITLAAINALFGISGHSHNGVAGQGPKIAYSNISGAPTSMAPAAHASTATTYGVSSATNYGHAMASSVTPLINGTAAVGTDNGKFAREGHVHPVQTTVSGNAGTATKLATTRKINGVDFDGSGDITIPVASIIASGSGPNYYWRKWSNGDIEQWFYTTSKYDMPQNLLTINFPLAFPNACRFVAPTGNFYLGDNVNSVEMIFIKLPLDKASVTVRQNETGGQTQTITYSFYATGN